MIGKIIIGSSFKNAVKYVLKNRHSFLLDAEGVDTESIESVINSFEFQQLSRPDIVKVVGHISLSFHPDDAPRTTDEFMAATAKEYMQAMGIENTQYIIVRHTNTRHPHLHLIFNRVNYDGGLIPDRFQHYRNFRVCKELTLNHGLMFPSKNKSFL